MLRHETLYVGVDIGKKTHVAGFISTTLLSRHQRFVEWLRYHGSGRTWKLIYCAAVHRPLAFQGVVIER